MPPVPVAAPGHEAEALHRARGDHVVELLDVSLGAVAPCSVPPAAARVARRGAARRPALDAGEAVTILAPIAACLNRMHAAGVAHGAVAPDRCCSAATGRPMLTGFGRAELFEPGLARGGAGAGRRGRADRAALARPRRGGAGARDRRAPKVAARLREEFRALTPDCSPSGWRRTVRTRRGATGQVRGGRRGIGRAGRPGRGGR